MKRFTTFLEGRFAHIERLEISFETWVVTFFAIGFTRTFLEVFSTRTETSVVTSDMATIVHYLFFYITIILALILITHLFSKKDIVTVSKVALVAFAIVWFPPLFDLIMSGGEGGTGIAYLFTPLSGFIPNFITFFGAHTMPGVTTGIRIELAVITLLIGIYTYITSQKYIRALLSMGVAYLTFFFLGALPSIIAALHVGEIQPSFYWFRELQTSSLIKHFFHPHSTFDSITRTFEMHFNGGMIQILFLITLPLLCVATYRWNAKKASALFRNSRFERMSIYLFMAGFGMFLAMQEGVAAPLVSWLDVTTLICLFVAVACIWLHAVCHNDIVDRESDAISNTTRPLVTGLITTSEMAIARNVFLFLAIIGGYAAGHYALFMVLVYAAFAYLYSVPPFKLKRFPLINPFIIGLCMLATMLAGFFTLSTDQEVSVFPSEWAFLIVILYTCIANVKDIKDIEGDRAAAVYTIPVLFGATNGKHIIGVLVFLSLQLIPLISTYTILWYTTIPFGILSYLLIHRTPYRDKHLFYLFFAFLICCSLLVM